MSDITPHIFAKRIGVCDETVRQMLRTDDEFKEFVAAKRGRGIRTHWTMRDVTAEEYFKWCREQNDRRTYDLDRCMGL